ncbi:MAG TPA: IS1595 family transposase [Candidatus Acidoferrum sp.]|nr:IS1595 family transposase [Candidatus Acidoferrum sp.]
MKLIDVTAKFKTDDDCLDYIEKMRWPNGELGCVHCGEVGRVSRIVRQTKSKNQRNRLFQCLVCGKQFSATSGTIFNDSHLPLVKWFTAIALICEAKKGISAKQVERHLGVNYRTAWHLCHRIREAMQDGASLLTGVVEVDETYVGGKVKRKGKPFVQKQKKDVVIGLIERGGKLKLVPVADNKMSIIEPVIEKHVSPDALLQTDDSAIYHIIGKRHAGGHRTINHSSSYGIGENHSNTIENAFSLLKRGVYGTFHKVSIKHLGRYCNEFSYRFNRRGAQLEMFDATLKNLTRGEALPYSKLTEKVSASENA